MDYQVNLFWKSIFPFVFATLVVLLIVLYGIKRRKKFDAKGERYVGGWFPIQENHYVESNQQTFIWFVFAFLCYLIAIWGVLIFVKDPSIWLENSGKIISLLLFFPLIGIAAWYTGWVITDAKKRNMDIKSYYLFSPILRHWFIRKNYPIVNQNSVKIKSFQRAFVITFAVWLFLALIVLFFVITNVDEIIQL